MLRHDDMDLLYQWALAAILEHGEIESPRGMKTKELRGTTLELTNPRRNITANPVRKINPAFGVAEFLWMLHGLTDVKTVAAFNKNIAKFSDDGVTFSGAYGPKLVEQLPYVIDCLRRDPSSRQALLTIWRERPGPSKDIPCTVSMQFLLRRHGLELIVYMRSNDAWLGLPYDIFNFTMLQRYVAAALNVEPSVYRHVTGSLHLYEEHWEKARQAVTVDMSVKEGLDWIVPSLTYPVPSWVLTYLRALAETGYYLERDPEGKVCDGWDSLIAVCDYYVTKNDDSLVAPWAKLYDLRRP